MSLRIFLLPLAVLTIPACNEYHTPSSISLPMTQGPSGAMQDTPDARPTVRFPARVAIARIEATGNTFHLAASGSSENPEHAAKAAALPGVRSVVPLNRIALTTSVKSYRELDREASKLGADLLAVYRLESEASLSDPVPIATLAGLFLLPTSTYRANTVATLTVRDARTGYIYGVLEERSERKGVISSVGFDSNRNNIKRKTENEAMDRLMEKLPSFWSGVVAKGR